FSPFCYVHSEPLPLPPFNITKTAFLKYLVLENITVQLPPIYVFGDSFVDASNNQYLNSPASFNCTPYGYDFGVPSGNAMGPATNGRTVVDFILAGLPFPPPILRLFKAQRKTTPTGVNHGSASSGKQPSPPPAIKIFVSYLTIYKLEARKFLLDNNVSPLGCVPANIHAKKHNTSCVEDINQRVAFFNGLLPNVLTKLKILTGSTLVGCDLYKLFEDVCNQPASYGERC
ncbi:hypothetical protein Golob_026795, partial [Gossypium lobatum]|nr:hypothetical protein [Gossypium lobatum]